MITLLAVSITVAANPSLGDRLDAEAPIHLTFALRADVAAMRALADAQSDPASPMFRHYLTPVEVGARFGSPSYDALVAWAAGAGLSIATFPNRLVIEAVGSSAQIEQLLGVELHAVSRKAAGRAASVHAPDRPYTLPAALASEVLIVTGLDTRFQHRRRLRDSYGNLTFGPQDLRRFYDVWPLLDAGFAGAGAQIALLGIAESPENTADPIDVSYYYQNVSNSTAVFSMDVLPNPSDDFSTESGKQEDELDVEAPTVGAPEASSITLVMPPAAEQFIAGSNEIVNNLPNTTAVSISYGNCEPQEFSANPTEPAAMRELILQGVLEGMTWSAASGDNGSDDCGDMSAPAVDFPCDIPEVLCLGGTEPQDAGFDANGAIPRYQPEAVWNEGQLGGAGCGGFSVLFAAPAYQTSAFAASFWPAGLLPDAGRVVPDLALLSAPFPGFVVDDTYERVLDVTGGTSVAAPLSAGFLALLADRLGCRLGDLHRTLYALGLAQFDGGAQVFHDITQGSVQFDGLPGADAGIGFDPTSGWGSVDLAALAAALPACPPLDAGFVDDAGSGPLDAGPLPPLTKDPSAYDPCADLGCDTPAVCQTLPEGLSRCAVPCDGGSAGCPASTACDVFGGCVPGNALGTQGAQCITPVDCAPSLTCFSAEYSIFPSGYCAPPCDGPGDAACPAGTLCDNVLLTGELCVTACDVGDGGCSDPNLVCQPQPGVGFTCLPPCQVQSDCDNNIAPGSVCDVATGVCEFGDGGSGSGTTGTSTASGTSSGASATIGASGAGAGGATGTGTGSSTTATSSSGGGGGAGGGCGCSSGGGDTWLLSLVGLALVGRRRYERRQSGS